MKKIIYQGLFAIVLVGLGWTLKIPEAKAIGADKACVYTVDTPDSLRVDCFGSGSVCSSAASCPVPQFG